MTTFRAAVLALPLFAVTACMTSGKKDQYVEGKDIWTKPRIPHAADRTPTSSTNYIAEIESARGGKIGSVIAGHDITDAKAKMEKIFEFARTNPHEFFAQLRRERPILSTKGAQGKVLGKAVNIPNIFLVTRYADVKEVLDHNTAFSVKPYAAIMDATVGSPYMLGREQTSANEEKPGMRRALHGKNDLVRVRAIIKSLAQRAITEGSKDGEIDVVKSITRSVPLGLNEEYFGFNGPSREASARWSRATQHAFFHNPFRDEKVNKASVQAGKEMREFISGVLVPQRRQELANGRPANDTVSQVLKMSHIHTQFGLSDDRIVANIIGLLVGSVETTSAAIAQSLQFLMENPGILAEAQRAAQEGDDVRFSKIVWEALRFDMVNPWLGRYSEEDYVLARGTDRETLIPKGSLVLASTESAMWDEEVFPQSSSFVINRDQSKFMHLGYGYHRCLGDDVSLVMVPETIKQILLLKNIRKANGKSKIDQDEGPFPESYVLAYDQEKPNVVPESAAQRVRSAAKAMGLEVWATGKLTTMPERRVAIQSLKQLSQTKVVPRREAIDKLPPIVTKAVEAFTDAERQNACAEMNPKSKEVFPNPVDRNNYCAVNMGFRSCYFIERLVAGQSAFTSYYHCAYGKNLLSARERDDFKQQMKHLDQFYFLNLEEGPVK
ncbi:MAG: cytochrome P450 [Bdellovibrionaceae bacterium]|nr:cytochrome P450 [Pseudobdellovibrionaceae bacterium]